MPLRTRLVASLFAVGGLTLAACANNTEGAPTPTGAAPTAQRDADLSAQVPADLRAAGTIVIGIDPPYTPLEFVQDGKIVGFDVDVFDAAAGVLNLKTDYRQAQFAKIIPAVTSGTYDVGNSSFTDTKERQATVDFIDYFNAGILWAAPEGKPVDPTNACGLTVAVKTGSYADTNQVPGESVRCTAAGKPPITRKQFTSQDSATNAVVLGSADAMSADSPLTSYAVKQSNGKLQVAGKITEQAPYGWAVAKDSPLGPLLQQALQKTIEDGTYAKICERWGLQSGAIDAAGFNGALN